MSIFKNCKIKRLDLVVEWFVFSGLCGLSAYYIYTVLTMFFAEDTSFKGPDLVVNNIQFVRNANEIPIKRDVIGVRADIIKIMLKSESEYLFFLYL